MTIEEAVRRKHEFERHLRAYLDFIACMTREEIELALGRLADHLRADREGPDHARIIVRGAILKMYLDLRTSGRKKQATIRRLTHRINLKPYFAARGRADHAAAVQAHLVARRLHLQRLADWKAQLKSLPLLKRLFARPPRPSEPPAPVAVELYVKHSCAHADLSEYFIASAAGYPFPTLPLQPADIHPQDIELLAP